MKFSLSDQYQHEYNSFDFIEDSILFMQENKHEKLAFKPINLSNTLKDFLNAKHENYFLHPEHFMFSLTSKIDR